MARPHAVPCLDLTTNPLILTIIRWQSKREYRAGEYQLMCPSRPFYLRTQLLACDLEVVWLVIVQCYNCSRRDVAVAGGYWYAERRT